jgi:TIR domain
MVRDQLLPCGIDTFVAHEMIEVSKEWQEEIELALATCNALAALVTKDLINSPYCDQEIGFAMGRRIVAIPIRQEADPHGFFAKFHGAPGGQGAYAHWTIADGIFDALVKNPKSKDKMGPAIVRRYCTSGSFDRARENTQYLIDMPKEIWTDEMVDEVEKAGPKNSQLDKGVWISTQQRIPDFVAEHLSELLDRKSEAAAAEVSDFEFSAAGDDDIPF